MTDPKRNNRGQFVRGNSAARTTGLYGRVKLKTGEGNKVRRVRAHQE